MAGEKTIEFRQRKKSLKEELADEASYVPVPREVDSIEVILKLTERCNIACTYCYFFDPRNEDYKGRPPTIAMNTVRALADYLAQAADDFDLKVVRIVIHGGEPLMYPKGKFQEMCLLLREALDAKVRLELSLQTNGTLLDAEWISIFEAMNIVVGVSLDGGQDANDRNRIDHKGKGTYRQAVAGIHALQMSNFKGLDVISVLDAEGGAAPALRHFVEELALRQAHFTVLDETHDTVAAAHLSGVSDNLMALYKEWRRMSHQGVYVRTFNRLLSALLSGDRAMQDLELEVQNSVTITVRSDGSVGPDDTFRNVCPELFDLGMSLHETTLKEYLALPRIARLHDELSSVPDDCRECCWARVCRAGLHVTGPLHRFSIANGFNNKNVHCDAIQQILLVLTQDALRAGASLNTIREVLCMAEPSAPAPKHLISI